MARHNQHMFHHVESCAHLSSIYNPKHRLGGMYSTKVRLIDLDLADKFSVISHRFQM